MPNYDLESVRIAAMDGRIEYRGRKVRQDVENLGYELSDVVDCVRSLTSLDFHRTTTYDNGDIDDAYVLQFTASGNTDSDAIYIKFALINDFLMIDLASFHLS